jgi:DNA replicative helicase MCM subunit Mcm2 (Cdc46/Mcm family)
MTLSPVVKNHHVEEAIRLFKFSTMDAVSAGSADGLSRGELNEEMTRIERELRRRLPVGWSTSYQSLVREFVTQQGYSSHALERTLFILEKRETIRFSGQVCMCQLSQLDSANRVHHRKRLSIGKSAAMMVGTGSDTDDDLYRVGV